tara:strand:- start:1068 stop:2033 length:966 start_codon:yes stop_codon:yes gene_type:complete
MKPNIADRAWYTLEEAAVRAGVTRAELLGWIDARKVAVALMSPLRRYLAFTASPEGELTGLGTCDYMGPLWMPENLLNEVLRGEPVKAREHALRPLVPDAVREWSPVNPYSRLPIGSLVQWKSRASIPQFTGHEYFTPQPREVATSRAVISESLNQMTANSDNPDMPKFSEALSNLLLPKHDAILDYSVGGSWSLSELLVSGEELSGIVGRDIVPSRAEVFLPFEPPLERVDALGKLVWRVLRIKPERRARDGWEKIKTEFECDDSATLRYDTENILVDMGSELIVWRAPGENKHRDFRWSTFERRWSEYRALAKKLLAAG